MKKKHKTHLQQAAYVVRYFPASKGYIYRVQVAADTYDKRSSRTWFRAMLAELNKHTQYAYNIKWIVEPHDFGSFCTYSVSTEMYDEVAVAILQMRLAELGCKKWPEEKSEKT